MFRKYLVLSIAIMVVALAAGCASVAPEPAPVPPTKTPKPTFTPTPDWTPTSVVFPTFTPVEPTATPEPTATEVPPTETPVPEARLTASQNVNVRSGPSTAYPAIGRLGAGESFVVTGRNSAGDWLQFDFNGRTGWVTTSLVTVTGAMDIVQVAQAPALPTAPPRPTARPQPTSPPAPPPPTAAPSKPWMYVSGSAIPAPQCGVVSFEGQVQYRDGSPQNGVCVYLGYYGPRTIKFSGGGGKGNGNWGFSPCGQSACTGPVEIYVVQCPGSVPEAGLTLDPGSPAPAPVSDVFSVTVTDKCVTGQWTNIVFRSTQQ